MSPMLTLVRALIWGSAFVAFGDHYAAYAGRVRRWLPRRPAHGSRDAVG